MFTCDAFNYVGFTLLSFDNTLLADIELSARRAGIIQSEA